MANKEIPEGFVDVAEDLLLYLEAEERLRGPSPETEEAPLPELTELPDWLDDDLVERINAERQAKGKLPLPRKINP